MAYDQIVFIGYVIDTAPKLVNYRPTHYLGIPDPKVDIAARCQLMLQAMELARTMIPAPNSPPAATLYVFMAPEFFFRGATGAYKIEDVDLIIETLQGIAQDDQWQDWVFVFGTIVAELTSVQKGQTSEPNEKNLIYNFSLIQEGGAAAAGPNGARIVAKEEMADNDFVLRTNNTIVKDGTILTTALVEHLTSGISKQGAEWQQVGYDGAGIFSMVGLTWAVEICIDHLNGHLKKSPQFPGEPLVQVELIPSCGCSIKENNVIAMTGGYVLNVDGNRKSSQADLCQVPMLRQQPISRKNLDITTVNLPTAVPPLMINVSDLYGNGSGEIYVYGAVQVPLAATVSGSTNVYSAAVGAGNTSTFTFYLIYDEFNKFSQSMVKIRLNKKDIPNNKYFIPFSGVLTFAPEPPSIKSTPGFIDISLVPGGNGYNHAVYAKINVPGFVFQGIVLQFMTAKNSSKQPQFCWQNP